jgi:hypothetical protein
LRRRTLRKIPLALTAVLVSFKGVVLSRRLIRPGLVVGVLAEVGNSVATPNHDVLPACVVSGRASSTDASLNVLLLEKSKLRAQFRYLLVDQLVLPHSCACWEEFLSGRDRGLLLNDPC